MYSMHRSESDWQEETDADQTSSRQFAEDAGHYKEDQTWATLHIDSACECGWNNYKAGKDGSTGIADGYKNGITL